MKKTVLLCALLFLVFSMAGSPALAEDDGAELYKYKFCVTCHGQTGVSVAPNYPNLAKQNQLYLTKQVRDIIEKKRANQLTLLMTENPVINSVNDQEIAAIAAHMTSIK